MNPKTTEIERFTEEDYLEELNETFGKIDICGLKYDAGYALKEIDPTAFRCGFADFQEYETVYVCGECGEPHDDEVDADECCRPDWVDEHGADLMGDK